MPVPVKDGPRANRDIRGVRDVQLIDQDWQNRGAMPFVDALRIAEDAGLDLVEIAPNSAPPVCKILDYGKYRYEQAKKKTATKADRVEVKTIRLRPRTDEHDRLRDDGEEEGVPNGVLERRVPPLAPEVLEADPAPVQPRGGVGEAQPDRK